MAPRKAGEKPSEISAPRRGVRKKTQSQSKSVEAKLKAAPLADLLLSKDDDQDSEYLPKKKSKVNQSTKININRIKPSNTPTANIEEHYTPEDGPPKKKRAKVNKQTHINRDDEDELKTPPDVVRKRKKRKINNENQTHVKVTDEDEATNQAVNQECPAHDNVKGKKFKTQNKNEIKIMLFDEATDESNDPNVTPTKAKRVKAKNKQNKKTIKLIITKEDGTQESTVRKIPQTESPKMRKRKSASKHNNNDTKIMLANEVIKNAFEKKKNVKNLNRPGRPKRPGRPALMSRPGQKKTIHTPGDRSQTANIEHNTISDGRELTPNLAIKKSVQDTNCLKNPSLPSADVPQQSVSVASKSPIMHMSPKKRIILSLKRASKLLIDQASPNTHAVCESKEETKDSAPVDNRTVFDCNESTAPDSTSKIDCETQKPKLKRVSSRKNSGTSTSTCLSWTKDISTSSSITCVTVKSSDFVRIDKKMPVVKLTNLDHQIKRKHLIDNIFEENSCDTSQGKSKCPSECSSVSLANLNLSQTLDLSTSSLTSSTVNRTAENIRTSKKNKDERISKLEQSLENLSCKMKNFDLEIINWIGYDNVNKDEKIENFHARIFEILRDENDVIKYCKEIKRVLVEDQTNETNKEYPKKSDIAHPEQVVENFTEIPSEADMLQTQDLNRHVLEACIESNKDDKNVQNHDEEFNVTKKSFNNIECHDNDDDDALSLFAESITALESSRKNSSLEISVSKDNNITQTDSDKSLQRKERVIVPIIYLEHEEPASCQTVNNVRKQTADSSSVVKKHSDSDLNSKFKLDNRGPSVNINNNYSDVVDLDFSCSGKQNTNDTTKVNKLNNSSFKNSSQFPNNRVRSPIDELENYRSDDFEHNKARPSPCSMEDSYNFSQDVVPVRTFINWKDTTDVIVVEDNNYVQSVDETDTSQSTMATKQPHVVSSSIFKGVCMFNLVMKCKNLHCTYFHKNIPVNFVKSELRSMSEDEFIKESMYLLKWTILKRKYGMCFIEECVERNMTVWMLDLIKEFILKTKKNRDEEAFSVEICEAALLHLNDVDMQTCADTLRSKIKPNLCLCDLLMKVISETQNFTRFKNVFIKLTLFMCSDRRSFTLDVATQLLERLCILPYDDVLARALMKIMENTNPGIFSVQMLAMLEIQLLKNNLLLYKELMGLKQKALKYSQNAESPPSQSLRNNSALQTSTPATRAESPDTTYTDFVNKTVEPVITRTITINRTIDASHLTAGTGSKGSGDTVTSYVPRLTRANWRGGPRGLLAQRRPRTLYNRAGFTPRAFGGNLPVCTNKQVLTNGTYSRRPP